MSTSATAATDFSTIFKLIDQIRKQMESVIIGKPEAIELALTALLARGHVLLEDLPGTGKTTLAKTLARSLGCDFNRVQFTPDLMPSDITGMNFYNTKNGNFEFRAGPVFTNILLADEINRTTPRTQSALLESMEEKQVTVDGTTYTLAQPFLVLATQNPVDSEGTFPLPLAQQDRFLLRIQLGYPHKDDERIILQKHTFGQGLDTAKPVINHQQVLQIQDMTQHVFLEETLVEYILNLVAATRQSESVELALSPRASISMAKAARAMALLKGRDYVLPDDIKALCIPVFAHRLKLTQGEKYKGLGTETFLQQLLDSLPLPAGKQ